MTKPNFLPLLISAAFALSAASPPPASAPQTPSSTTAAPTPQVYGPPAEAAKGDRLAILAMAAPPGIPPSLLRAAASATENHPAIRNAEAQLRASRADLRGARWQRFPSVTLEALAVTQGREGIAGGGLTANVVGEQPIYTFGKLGANIDRAEAAVSARRATVDETAQQLALQVIDTFYNIALSARRQAVLENGLAQHRALLGTIQNRVRQEVSPQSDLDLAMSRTAQVEQDLELTRAQRAAQLSRLVQLVGTSAMDLGNVPEYDKATMHPSQEGAVERALFCDPKLARLRADVLAAEAEAKIAKSSIFPQVLGQVSHNEVTGTRAGVVLRAQTGSGLSQFAASDAARTRVQAAEFNVLAAERELREALQLDFVNNKSSAERIEANLQAALTSELVTESYKRQFITGRRTWLDVMNAVREATSSKLQMADAQIAAMTSNAHIWLRTCGWQPRSIDSGAVGPDK